MHVFRFIIICSFVTILSKKATLMRHKAAKHPLSTHAFLKEPAEKCLYVPSRNSFKVVNI